MFSVLACSSISIDPNNYLHDELVPDWPLYGADANRSNYRAQTLAPPLELRWTFKASSAISPTVVAVDGLLYFGTLDGRIYAVSAQTGEKVGRLKVNEGYETTCAYYDGSLIYAIRYGRRTLVRYDVRESKRLWGMEAGHIASEPLVASKGVFVAALYNHVDRYALDTGDRIWRFDTDGQHRSSPALAGEALVVGCDSGQLYALNAATGKLKWEHQAGAGVLATPCIGDSTVYVGALDSVFYALDLADGSVRWRFRAQDAVVQPAATDGKRVLFGSNDGRLYALAARTGEKLWQFEAKSVVSTPPVIAGGVVYFGSLDHHYYALDVHSGQELWRYETEGRVRTAPVVWGRYLFGASEDRYVYAFSQPEHPDTD